MSVRCLIVDDEKLARLRIVKLLKKHPEILVIAEARNGNEAIIAINQNKPDLIFLDIQMPDINGFEVLKNMILVLCQKVLFLDQQ